MCQFELSLGPTVGLCVWATLFTLIPFQSVQCDWRAIIRWCLSERKKNVNNKVRFLLVMEQNKTMDVFLYIRGWGISRK